MPTLKSKKAPFLDLWREGVYTPTAFQKVLFESFDSLHHLEQSRLRVRYPESFGLDDETATATIFSFGDRSVGIQSSSYSMTIHRDLIQNPAGREQMRKSIRDFYSEICDGFVVTFDDEVEPNDY